MNYTYLAATPWTSQPTIVMTTPPGSRKTRNLVRNPRVSLLVHDWVAHRPRAFSAGGHGLGQEQEHGQGQGQEHGQEHGHGQDQEYSQARHDSLARQPSSLAAVLAALNTSELSRSSITVDGTAGLVASGTAEEGWLKARHLANNTFHLGDDSGGHLGPENAFGRENASGPADHTGPGDNSGPGSTSGPGDHPGLNGDYRRRPDSPERPDAQREGDGGRECYITGDEVRVVLVRIQSGRITDWKGRFRDWLLQA